MLDTTKAMINNVNQFKYLKNRDRVTYKKEAPVNTNNIVNEDGSNERIELLQNDIRVNNLRTFAGSYFSLRVYRFFVVSLPAVITAASIGLFFTASRVDKKDTATHYIKSESIYKSDEGIASSTSDVYDLNEAGDFWSHRLVSPEGVVENGPKDYISVRIHDGHQCFTGNIGVSVSGRMTVQSTGTVSEYFDSVDYPDVAYSEGDTKEFEDLFDRVIGIIKENGNLSDEDEEILSSLTSSDKKVILLDIVSYQDKGVEDVILSKTKIPRRVVLAIIAVIYDLALICSYTYRKENLDVDCLDYSDGKLVIDHTEYSGSVWYAALKMKEAFLAAERERILLLSDEIDKNVYSNDRKKLLTGYERRLVNKVRKAK